MLANSGGEVTVLDDIVQLKVLDGDCAADEFEALLECVLSVFRAAAAPLRLILNAHDEEVASEHVAALATMLQDTTFDPKFVRGTALIMTPMQATVASMLIASLKFTRPVRVFSDYVQASAFIASL